MKSKLKFIVMMGGVLVCAHATTGEAHSQGQCLNKSELQNSITVRAMDDCVLRPLSYQTNGPDGQNYWSGGYTRKILAQKDSLVVTSNICIRETIATNPHQKTPLVYTKEFLVLNPNLLRPLRHSWEELPLTPEEAQRALSYAQQQCEGYQLQDAHHDFDE